ncbi:MAG: M56 family metallopeptidase [Intestinimonas sp.]|nr:M56 family metallopeptidase [Intestinimonas sp.]
MNSLFLNLLRTSLVVGSLALVLSFASPLWNRSYRALWKKRLWCLLAGILLFGTFVTLPEGTVRAVITVPERRVQVVQNETGGSRIQVVSSNAADVVQSAPPDLQAVSQKISTGSNIRRSVDLMTAAELIWATGTAVFFLWLAVGEYLFHRRVRRWAKPVRSGTLRALYREVCANTHKAHVPELLICPQVDSPMLVGLFKTKLLLPTEDGTGAEMSFILRHELAHWQNRDLWWKLLILSANAVHWFNPAVWLLRREANRDIERACDERVMRYADTAERRTYSEVLLAAVKKGTQPALSTCFYGGVDVMRERLRNILTGNKRQGVALATACALMAVCAVPLVACTQKNAAEEADGAVPEAVQTMAEEYVQDAVRYVEAQNEWDSSANAELETKIQITDSEITKLEKIGQAVSPDGSGDAEAWALSYRLKLKNPDKVILAGDRIVEDGWLTLNENSYNQPILGVWRDKDGTYEKLATDIAGGICETTFGSCDFYTAELLRQYNGLRPDRVNFPANGDTDDGGTTYVLKTADREHDSKPDAGWSIYVPENWKQEALRMGNGVTTPRECVRFWHAPEEQRLAVMIYFFDGMTSENMDRLKTILTAAAADGDFGDALTDYDSGESNLDTSSGLVGVRTGLTTGGDVLRAYAVDAAGGCWAVVTRCPDAERDTMEGWLWDAFATFCANQTAWHTDTQTDSALDAAVADAILSGNQSSYLEGECQGEGHFILDSKTEGATVTAYTLTMYGNYGFQDGNFVTISGTGVIPVVMTFKVDETGTYSLTDYQEPQDGSGYSDSIRKMFPEALQGQCLNVSDDVSGLLQAQKQTYAERYLKSMGREAVIGEYGEFKHPLLTDRGVSVAVSNAMSRNSDYPYWIGNLERIEDGVRYVYQMDYDSEQHQIIYTKSEYDTGKAVKRTVFDSTNGREIVDP